MTVASLIVSLEARTAQFIDNMEQAAHHMEMTGRRITRAGMEITKMFAPLTALYAGALLAAVKQSEIVHGQLAQAWDRLVLSGRLLLREIGGALTPAFQQMIASKEALIQKARELVAWFEHLSPATQALIIKIGLFLAVLGPTVVIIGSVIRGVGALWMVFSQLAGLISTVVVAVFSFLISPVGLVTLGIVALIGVLYLLIRHWELVKDGASIAWNFILSIVIVTVDKIMQALETMFVAAGWTKMVDKIEGVRDHLRAMAFDVLAAEAGAKKLWSAYSTPLLPEWLTSLPAKIKAIFTLPTIAPLPSTPILAAQDALDHLHTKLLQNAEAAKVFGSSFDLAAANAADFKSTIDGLLALGYTLDTVLNKNGLTLRKLGAEFEQFASKVHVALGPYIAQTIHGFASAIGDVLAGATKGLSGFGNALLGVIGSMMVGVGGALIALGTARLAALSLNPFAAIAAGAALVVFGEALSKASQAVAGGGSAGGGSSGGGGVAAPAAGTTDTSTGSGTIVLEFRPGLIDFSDPVNQDRLAQALRDLTGRHVQIVPVMG